MSEIYQDEQVFTPEIMEKLARAYHDSLRDNQASFFTYSQKTILHLNMLYSYCLTFKQHLYQKKKICVISSILSQTKNDYKNIQPIHTLLLSTENSFIRKIISLELKIIEDNLDNKTLIMTHIKNIESIMNTF